MARGGCFTFKCNINLLRCYTSNPRKAVFLALRGREIGQNLNTADTIRPSVACWCRIFSYVEMGKILVVVFCSFSLSDSFPLPEIEVLNKPSRFVLKSKHKTPSQMLVIPNYYRKINMWLICDCYFFKNI